MKYCKVFDDLFFVVRNKEVSGCKEIYFEGEVV